MSNANVLAFSPHHPQTTNPRRAKKQIRIIKKIRSDRGVWQFISLRQLNGRYVWDKRDGYYFIEWWEGKRRRRELAGRTPSQATEAQRRKRNELIGEQIMGGAPAVAPRLEADEAATRIPEAIDLFTAHIETHKQRQLFENLFQSLEINDVAPYGIECGDGMCWTSRRHL